MEEQLAPTESETIATSPVSSHAYTACIQVTACPKCKQGPGFRCKAESGEILYGTPHGERIDAYYGTGLHGAKPNPFEKPLRIATSSDTLKTFADWHAAGRRITKGSKAVARNAAGVPMFTKGQTTEFPSTHKPKTSCKPMSTPPVAPSTHVLVSTGPRSKPQLRLLPIHGLQVIALSPVPFDPKRFTDLPPDHQPFTWNGKRYIKSRRGMSGYAYMIHPDESDCVRDNQEHEVSREEVATAWVEFITPQLPGFEAHYHDTQDHQTTAIMMDGEQVNCWEPITYFAIITGSWREWRHSASGKGEVCDLPTPV